MRGPRGIGKLYLARVFAQALLCESPRSSGLACGGCVACHWFSLGNHPDFRFITPEAEQEAAEDAESTPAKNATKASRQIRIDQVRSLREWAGVGAHRAGRRVALIQPAEAMNQSTANALLKTLEEPSAGAVFILVAHESHRLLPTIISRCQALDCARPPHAMAGQWLSAREAGPAAVAALDLVGGAPFAALDAKELPALAAKLAGHLSSPRDAALLTCASEYQGAAVGTLIDLMQKWIYDVLAARCGLPIRYYRGHEDRLRDTARKLDPMRATDWARELTRARRLADHPLNPRLVLEQLFIAYRSIQRHSDG